MSWCKFNALSLELVWRSAMLQPIEPWSHHGGFHMEEWPWWPGPLHWAWPAIVVAVVGGLIYLAARRR